MAPGRWARARATAGSGPSGESTRYRRRSSTRKARSTSSRGSIGASSWHVPGLEPLAALRAQARAVRLAQRGDGLLEADRLDDERPQLQLVVVRQARRLGVIALLERDRKAAREVDRRAAPPPRSAILTGVDDRAQAAGALAGERGRRARRRRAGRGSCASAGACPSTGSARTRPSPGSTRRASISYSRTVPGGSAIRPDSANMSGSPSGRRGAVAPGPGVIAGPRPGPSSSLDLAGLAVGRRRPPSSVGSAGGQWAARRSSSIAMPRLMLWSVRVDLALEARRGPRRVLVGAAPDARRPRVGVAMIRRLSSSAASVSPRSSMRNAACSWARATIRSASSWAFSMIRSPSGLIRFAGANLLGHGDAQLVDEVERGVLVDDRRCGSSAAACRSRSATRAARRGR